MIMNQAGENAERPRKPDIIAVEESHVLAARLRYAPVACRARSSVRLSEHARTRTKPTKMFHRSVRGTVVHDDDFVIGEALLPHRFQCEWQKLSTVECGNNDGEQHGSSCLWSWRNETAAQGG